MIFIFRNSQIHPDEVEDDNEVKLVPDFNVDEIKSYPNLQNIETWQANCSSGNTPMTIKNSVPVATHSFPVPTHLISICWWFSA